MIGGTNYRREQLVCALFVSLLVSLFAIGCAKKSSLYVLHPAKVDVSNLERLAVLEFEGPGDSGKAMRSAVASQFWDSHFYTLVEPTELQRFRPIYLPDGHVDDAA